jgi:hypothetical protein
MGSSWIGGCEPPRRLHLQLCRLHHLTGTAKADEVGGFFGEVTHVISGCQWFDYAPYQVSRA